MALVLILIAAFVFRFIIITNSSLTFFSDDAIYASLARAWVQKDWQYVFHPTWPPLFPLFSAFIYLVYPHWETSLRLVSALAGTFILIPLFYLLKRGLSLLHAILFTLAISLFSPMVYTSVFPLSDALSATFIVSSIVSVFFAIKSRNNLLFLLAGFLLGLTYLTRSEGLMFFSLSSFYIIFHFAVQSLKQRGKFLKNLLLAFIFIAAFIITISPYVVVMRNRFGEWALSTKFSAQIQQGHAFALRGNNTTWSQEVVSVKSPNYKSSYFKNGYSFILEHEDYLIWWFLQKFKHWEGLFMTFFPMWSLFVISIGILNTLFRKQNSPYFYLFSVILFTIPATIFSTTISDIRYLLWTIPFFLFYFYLGIDSLFYFSKIFFHLHYKKLSIISAFVATGLSFVLPAISPNLMFHPITYSQEFTKNHYREVFLKVANWIKSDFKKENPKIMARHEMIEFYTNGETIYLPQISYEELIRYAKDYNVDYIIAWAGELGAEEDLITLLNPEIKHPGLKKVYSVPTPEGNLVVYKLSNQAKHLK